MTRPRLLIVDDHVVVAEGVVRLLAERFETVGTIADGRGALEAVERLQPDVMLLDLSMPEVSGLEILRHLKASGVACRVVVFTMHAEGSLAVEALRLGAAGFVLKESSGDELLNALDVVLRGDTYLAASLTRAFVTLVVGPKDPDSIELSGQQREVLRLIVQGRRAKEIAVTLGVSTRTVQAAKSRMMQLLNVHSTAELVRLTIEHRLVPL